MSSLVSPRGQAFCQPITSRSMAVEEKLARHGEKTIRVSVKFWTDDIATKEGHVLPGFCWEGGFVNVEARPSPAARQFNLWSILGLPAEPTLQTEIRFLVVDRAAGWTHLAFPKTSTDSFTDRLSIRF